MAYQTILFERNEGVGVVTLNRPAQLNAFTPKMLQELADVFRGMERDPEVRVILITGAGKAFCGGEDFKSRAESEVAADSPPPTGPQFRNETTASPYNIGYSNSHSVEPPPRLDNAPSYSPLNPGPPPNRTETNGETALPSFDSLFNPKPGPFNSSDPAPAPGFMPAYSPSPGASSPQPASIPRQLPINDQVRRAYNPLIKQIRSIEKPVIALVNGVAAGTGLGLALACDIRYASERARFLEVSIRVGLLPGGGTSFFLPRLIGLSKALELAFGGDELSASEAEKLGLVSKIIPEDQLLPEGRKLAVRLAKGPTRAIGLTKSLIYSGTNMTLDQALELEAKFMEETTQTDDYKEGLRAFLEKRPPKYRGQ